MLRNHRMQVMRTIKHYKSDPGSYFIKKLLKLSYIQKKKFSIRRILLLLQRSLGYFEWLFDARKNFTDSMIDEFNWFNEFFGLLSFQHFQNSQEQNFSLAIVGWRKE